MGDEKKILLPVGTKIKFIKSLYGDATGDRPDIVYAREGDEGVVIGHACKEGHWVKRDVWPTPFGAVLGEEFIDSKY